MKVERIIRDLHMSVRDILRALDNGVQVEHNFGVSRAPAGWVITSVGTDRVPQWQPLTIVPGDGTGTGGDGITTVDLSNYYTKVEINALIAGLKTRSFGVSLDATPSPLIAGFKAF